MPTAENQLTWLRLNLGYIGPITLQDQHRQTLRAVLVAGQTWQALPYVAKREAAKRPAQRTGYRGLGHTVDGHRPRRPHPSLVCAAPLHSFERLGESGGGPTAKRDAGHRG